MCNTTDGDGLPAWPERAARRTAANAVLADFRRETDNWIKDVTGRQPEPLWRDWSMRLADNLSLLISCVSTTPAGETS